MTARDACDVLVVSAFPGDYMRFTTAPSVISALADHGLFVEELAANPEIDLRTTTSCWLSRAMPTRTKIRLRSSALLRACSPRTTAASTVGDIFRALVPFVGPEIGIRDVAMPIVASGNMRCATRKKCL